MIHPRGGTVLIVLFSIFFGLVSSGRAQGLLLDEPGADPELERLEAARHDNQWWNADWGLRRPVTMAKPAFQMAEIVLLKEPSPLFLYNTGRCGKGGADVRVVDHRGRALRCGVVNFGQDDGTSFIWFMPGLGADGARIPARPGQRVGKLWLYYGNPKAVAPKPLSPRYDIIRIDPVEVTLGEEETRPGWKRPRRPTGPGFFDDIVIVEAETFRGPEGQVPSWSHRHGEGYLVPIGREGASGGLLLAPTKPWRPRKRDYPVFAHAFVELPKAGKWHVHVRWRVTQRVHTSRRILAKHNPFTVKVGDHEVTCGENQSYGVDYRYTSFRADLPAGRNRIDLTMPDVAAVDCLIFTRHDWYLPDVADLNGPVWMRFKVLPGPRAKPCYIQLFCVNVPWSSHGPQGETACWFFRDSVQEFEKETLQLAADRKNYIPPGQWSPWGEALHSRYPTWWSTVKFLDRLHRRPSSMTDIRVSYEFATRGSEHRVFRSGTEKIYLGAGLYVLMPTELNMNHVVKRTLTFSDWARERFDMVKAMGFAPDQGPRRIIIGTHGTAWSPEGAQSVFKTMNWLGFNTLKLDYRLGDVGHMHEQFGVPYHFTHRFVRSPTWHKVRQKPLEGLTYAQTVDRVVREDAERLWKSYSDRVPAWKLERTRQLVLGDEIGPAISYHFINAHPLFLGYFREWLAAQGHPPHFFGVEKWEDIQAMGYGELGRISQNYMNALLHAVDPEYEDKQEAAEAAEARELIEEQHERFQDEVRAYTPGVDRGAPDVAAPSDDQVMQEEEQKAADALSRAGRADVSKYEKRLYYYTQRFRTHYTCQLYRHHVAALNTHHDPDPYASPNFQAMPAMRGQMWSGALNLFEFGRDAGTNTLWLEDWTWSAHKVVFGMRLLRAAARERDLPLSAYLVGGGMMNRALVDLSLGCWSISSYLYGPLRVIGPPWAEQEKSVRDFGRFCRWAARLEEELLASRNRACDAAVLVANTSEINGAFYDYPLFDRIMVFDLLQTAHVPVEVLGEDEILADPKILQRYQILYVIDPHVLPAVQKRIKEWVREGGFLWGGYAAFARDQFDEPVTIMNEVFGIRARGRLKPCPMQRQYETAFDVTVHGGEGLRKGAFEALHVKGEYEPSTARSLATFADGTPAILHNRFGKGQVWLAGFQGASLVDGYFRRFDPARPHAEARRAVVAGPARVAGVRPHAGSDRYETLNIVRDGQGYSIAFFINSSRDDLGRVRAWAVLPARPKSAVDGDGKAVPFTWENRRAFVELDLPARDGKIILFRY